MKRHTVICGAALAAALLPVAAWSQTDGAAFADRFAFVGQVQPRSAQQIAANDWHIGTEAIDRNYSTFAKWAPYLGPLGAKHARLQGGWARTDLGGGRYDWRWLDEVVDGMRKQGVQPWVEFSYGNPRYAGGGTERRDSPTPTGEGHKAWLAYVAATVAHFRGRVVEWEIWNEPNGVEGWTPEVYATFARDTEKVIRATDPKAGIIFGAVAGAPWPDVEPDNPNAQAHERRGTYTKEALEIYYRLGGRAEAVTYHGYSVNPDAIYPRVDRMVEGIRAIDPKIQVRQGENGAPSLNQPHYAFRNLWWTEQSQAKWMLRRMMGDAARGIPTSVFTMTEMHYPVAAETQLNWVGGAIGRKGDATTAKHFKGLVETKLYAPGTPQDDRTVVRTKMAYPAMQAVTAIFDSRLKPVGPCQVQGPAGPVSAHAFRRDDGAAAIVVWRSGDTPDANTQHELADVRCPGAAFKGQTAYIDLLTRAVYANRDKASGDGVLEAKGLPIYDSPVVLADAVLVEAR